MEPWHWRSIPLQHRSGADVLAALFQAEPIHTLLESPAASPIARYSICAGSPRIVDGQQQLWTPGLGDIFPQIGRLLAGAKPIIPAALLDLPFTGGWLGWLGYEAVWEIEKLPALAVDPLPFPVAYWYEPANFAVIDHQQQQLHLAVTCPPDLERLLEKLAQASPDGSAIPIAKKHQTPTAVTFLTDGASYQAAVVKALGHIGAGDIYQANLSVRFQVATARASWDIYRQLQQINPSPFASYWQTPWGEMASCSPERLVSYRNGVAETRPIAGTRPRGLTAAADHQLAAELLENRKEIAEHIMLVDLERNDLGKVCTWGSVEVDELLSIERYSHVMHLVSNVRGTLGAAYSPIDLLMATFPGGTITGCPKIRCMEIIAELEPQPRNLFYGSCGYLDWRGHLDLNILIRTLLCADGLVWGQVGAGVVADSDPEREWWEALQKAQAQIQALGLLPLETP